jgi:DNA-binding CsgD family transcriptional regulator
MPFGSTGRRRLVDPADAASRDKRLVDLRVAGYSREQMAELTRDSFRTVDRQLGRAQRKLRDARRGKAEIGSRA